MAVEDADVKNIGRLAHLDITASEIQKYVQDLNNIMQMVEAMGNIDTSAIEPMSHPLTHNLALREDEVTETNQRELFQSIAPATAAGLYLVPQVIE